ncbi:MAG: hypothetical protein KC502_12235 [Myxococcales bacterium]|nr:hypothetical protein [Myxococcales bacterium]
MSQSALQTRALVVATAVAAPVALALETTIRLALLPPDFEQFRIFLRPTLTWVAWALVVASALSVSVGVSVHQRLYDRALAKSGGRSPRHIAEAHAGAFLLSASVPQIPTLVATLTFTLGAEPLPVVLALIVSTIGVAILGAKAWRAASGVA